MKKQILTFAFLATVAVGGAVAGTKSLVNARPSLSSGACITQVDCQPGDNAVCEFSGTQYSGDDGAGMCSEQLEKITP